ncbi:restriction endonuclease subunit S [Phocaeicola sp.]|uniref:restriction endonuclease subunit S n=1 Tax=Phocaeicola sp. TaxID=2773926 RepID=UPI003869DB6F
MEDIVSFGGGKTPSMDNKEYWYNGNHLWVTSKDMKYSHITNSLMKITDKALEVMTIYERGTLLVVTRSGILRHTLPISILETPATVNQDLKAISPYIQELSEYLYIIIKANEHYILKEYHKDGTTVDSIDFEKFKCLPIPLAPITEQRRIIAETKHWFALIEQINQSKSDLQTLIKQTKSKILDLAIHGKLVPQDPNDEPASELLKRINPDFTPCDNAHYTQLPKGWAMCKLSDLCKIENGFAFSSDDYKSQGIPLVRISNITHNTIDITDCAYIEGITDDKFKISKGDLLIAMSGATTGKMGVYPFDETAYLNQRVGNIKILNKSSLYPNYRNTYMQSKVDEILKIAYGGAQPNISASVIGNFDFPLPPYKEQIRIVETVQRIFDQLDVITESL